MTKVVDVNKAQDALNRAAASTDHAGRFRLKDRLAPLLVIEYDDQTYELDITFTSGKKYRYFGVPREVYDEFVQAPSKGQFFNAGIKDRYEFSEILPKR